DISIQDEFKRVQGISIQIKPVERAEYFIELITMLVLAQETEQLSVLKDSGKNIIELAIDSIKAINHGVTKAELSIDLVNILTQVQEQKTISNMDEYIDTLISIAYTCSAEITDLVKIRLFTHLLISLARAGFSQKIEEYGLLVEIRRSINSAVQKVDMAKLVQLREELNQYLLDALYSLVYYQKPSGEVEEKEINIDELRAVLQKIVVELARLNRPVPVKTIDIPDEFIAALWQASTIKEPVYIQDSLRVLAGCIKLIEKLSARSKYFKELIEYIEKFQDKLGLDKDGLISYWERMDVDKHVLTEKKSESSANNFQLRNLTQVQEAQMLIGQAI
ncbi:MAG: hypothetical protein L6416_07040, partial [Candidatus Omnitrophica bacterium]|nr:hypothetical protein [Candidatus Omnitrophota bacterium]